MERYYMKGFESKDSWKLYRVSVGGTPPTEIFAGTRFQTERLKNALFSASEAWPHAKAGIKSFTIRADATAPSPWSVCDADGSVIVGRVIKKTAIEICEILNAEQALYLQKGKKLQLSIQTGAPKGTPWR